MNFGILKENEDETRVSLLPEGVEALIKMGHKVNFESGAGESAGASDESYRKVGATLTNRSEVLDKSECVLKITPPKPEEISKLRPGLAIMGVYSPLSNFQLIKTLAEKNISVFSFDMIPRTTRAQSMDVLSSMSTISGYKAVLLAASTLPRFFPMLTTAAGTIAPARALVLGAGVAGLQAIATARRLGAVIEAFDTRPEVKEQVMSLGAKFVEVEGAKDASGAGGYAVEQTEEYKQRQAQAIHKAAAKADIIVTTALIPGKRAPILIMEDTVREMKKGSVIVDLASAGGGNCQMTEPGKTVTAHGVTIIGHTNLPSTMPQDASRMYGKNVINFLKNMIKGANWEINFADDIVAGTCIAHGGAVKNAMVQNLLGS